MLASDIKAFYAETRADDNTNGGRMSANEVVSGLSGDFFVHVDSVARLALTEELEKIFLKCHDDSDGTGANPKVFYDGDASAGDDFCIFYPGTQTDTEADTPLSGAQGYAAGTLKTAITAGVSSSLTIVFKDDSQAALPFNGGELRITSKTRFNLTGNEEYLTVDQAPSVTDNEVTLHFSETLANSYAAGVLVSMVYLPADDVECTYDSFTVTTAGDGDYDDTTYPLLLDNIGTVEDDFTLTFSDATTFTGAGDSEGSLGAGSTAADYAPQNADWSKPFFTLDDAGFSGTWANGDTITFTTHPASVPVWELHTNPADAEVTNSNSIWIVLRVEAA